MLLILKSLENLKNSPFMDSFFLFLQEILPVLLAIAGASILVKSFLVFKRKGMDMPAFVHSFFRIYDTHERHTAHRKENQIYMLLNNLINFYLYAIMFIFIVMLIIFKSNVLR
jgi:hypothetical protein